MIRVLSLPCQRDVDNLCRSDDPSTGPSRPDQLPSQHFTTSGEGGRRATNVHGRTLADDYKESGDIMLADQICTVWCYRLKDRVGHANDHNTTVEILGRLVATGHMKHLDGEGTFPCLMASLQGLIRPIIEL